MCKVLHTCGINAYTAHLGLLALLFSTRLGWRSPALPALPDHNTLCGEHFDLFHFSLIFLRGEHLDLFHFSLIFLRGEHLDLFNLSLIFLRDERLDLLNFSLIFLRGEHLDLFNFPLIFLRGVSKYSRFKANSTALLFFCGLNLSYNESQIYIPRQKKKKKKEIKKKKYTKKFL